MNQIKAKEGKNPYEARIIADSSVGRAKDRKEEENLSREMEDGGDIVETTREERNRNETWSLVVKRGKKKNEYVSRTSLLRKKSCEVRTEGEEVDNMTKMGTKKYKENQNQKGEGDSIYSEKLTRHSARFDAEEIRMLVSVVTETVTKEVIKVIEEKMTGKMEEIENVIDKLDVMAKDKEDELEKK